MSSPHKKWTENFIKLLLGIIILSGLVLATNNPGHDSLYIEETGNSTITGNLNLTGFLTIENNIWLKSYLDILANGSVIA